MAKNTPERIGLGRILRVCDLCGGVDDHPRHVIAGGTADVFPRVPDEILDRVVANAPAAERTRLIRELLDTSSSDRHMDCCREAGCPSGACDQQTAGAEDLRGSQLIDHLMSKAEG